MIEPLLNSLGIEQWGVQAPGMLVALLSLLIPILIHLFSKSRGKLVPIGDIRFIAVKKLKRMTEIRLVDRLLLALRLLLLLLICLLLAKLYLSDHNQSATKQTILVTQDWLNYASEEEKQNLVQQLSHDENNLLLLDGTDKGFSPLTEESIQSITPVNDEEITFTNVWHSVSQIAELLKPESPMTVYTTNRLNQFVGERPSISAAIDWQIKSVPAPANKTIDNAIHILVINDDDRREDIRFLNAAFTSLQETHFPGLKIDFLDTSEGYQDRLNNIRVDSLDTIFYLSEIPLSASLEQAINSGSHLIVDASSEIQTIEASVRSNIDFGAPQIANLYSSFSLHQVGLPVIGSNIASNRGLEVIWKAANGAPVLIASAAGEGEVYSFYSRFNPNWNNWVLNASFPFDLIQLIINKPVEDKLSQSFISLIRLSDNQISHNESIPAKASYSKARIIKNSYDTPILLAFLIVLIFCLERLLSEVTLNKRDIEAGDHK